MSSAPEAVQPSQLRLDRCATHNENSALVSDVRHSGGADGATATRGQGPLEREKKRSWAWSPRAATEPRLAAEPRLVSIDWVRGLAVLIMIQAHVTDAWTEPVARTTAAFRYLTILGGFAAPLFLWLAGLSLVLAGESTLRRTGSVRRSWQRLVQRGLEIFVLAFLFRATAFLFNPGGAVLTLFRVDILNVMGPALVVVGLIWGAMRTRSGQIGLMGLTAVAIAMLTPVVRTAAWVDLLPVWLQWYMRPSGDHTVFTLFPWTGFVFAGAASGAVLGGVQSPSISGSAQPIGRRSRVGALLKRMSLQLSGVGILAIGLIAGEQPSIYAESSYWTTSPAFFAVRSGIVLLAVAAVDWAAFWLAGASVRLEPLRTFGRASLLVYWVHVHVTYGWITSPLHKHLNISQLAVAYVTFCLAMYAVIPLRDRARAAWQAQRRIGSSGPRTASA